MNLTPINDTTTNNLGTSSAYIYDTSNNTLTYGTAAVANGAYFIGGSSNSGSGSYRALYKLKSNGEQSGYNRPGVFDSSVLGGDTHIITKSELTSTNDGQYYIFSLDLNEGNEGLISLDDFRIYTGSSDPAPLPNTEADLDKLGILRFNMNENREQPYPPASRCERQRPIRYVCLRSDSQP